MAITGSGTSGDPYIIYDFSDLELIGTAPYTLDKYFKLNNDIDASPTQDPAYNGGAGWTPRGTLTGGFDGNNKNITNLYINRPAEDNVGFFNVLSTNFYNLNLLNCDITGQNYVGGIAGQLSGSIIIDNCKVTGNIQGTIYIGGFIGYMPYGDYTYTITNSESDATISGDTHVGGFIGYEMYYRATPLINNCVSRGTITGTTQYIGGFIGYSTYKCRITNSQSYATVTGGSEVGGFVGRNESTSHEHYYDTLLFEGVVSGDALVAGIIGTLNGWNASSYTRNITLNGVLNINNDDCGGVAGYARTPIYNVTTGEDFRINPASTSNSVGGVVGRGIGELRIYNCDIKVDISGNYYIGGLLGYGTYSSGNIIIYDSSFDGTIEGNKYVSGITGLSGGFGDSTNVYNCTIKGLIRIKPDSPDPGYIGAVSGYRYRHIQDITINRSELTIECPDNTDFVGGLVGALVGYGNVLRCKSDLDLNGRSHIGGLVGGTNGESYANTTFIECVYEGDITSTGSYVGGIIGYHGHYGSGSVVRYCYTSGSIICSGDWVGGLCGVFYRLIENCYSNMNITGNSAVGGLVGQLYTAFGGTYNVITNSYSVGAVSASYSVGGLVGISNPPNASATSSYWDTETSGQSSSVLGTGKTTSEMKTQETFVDWDFDTIWDIVGVLNDGYPFLRLFPPSIEVIISNSIDSLSEFGCGF